MRLIVFGTVGQLTADADPRTAIALLAEPSGLNPRAD
jgi:hypothetical protein